MRATRDSTTEPFNNPVQAPNLQSPNNQPASNASLTADGLTIYLSMNNQAGAPGGGDIFVATRSTTTTEFGAPSLVAGINEAFFEFGVTVTPSGERLYFNSSRSGMSQLWMTTKGAGGMFGTPVLVPGLEAVTATMPTVRDDELQIFYETNENIFVASRTSATEPFGTPEPVSELAGHRPSWISPDGCTIYLDEGGASSDVKLFEATRPQ